MSKIINKNFIFVLALFTIVFTTQYKNVVADDDVLSVVDFVATDDRYSFNPKNKFYTDISTAITGPVSIFLGNDTYNNGPVPGDAIVHFVEYSEICHPQDVEDFRVDTQVNFNFNCNEEGIYTFKYNISYNGLTSNTATVEIFVGPSNRGPTANDTGDFTINQGEILYLISTTTDPIAYDEDGDPLIFTIHTQPLRGILSGLTPETTPFVYIPDESYFGFDTFKFFVSDGIVTTDTPNTVTINILKKNQRPKLTLIGSSTIDLAFAKPYIEKGATSTDVEDGDLTDDILISGNVNTLATGTYTITYSVTDKDENETLTNTKTRTINIVNPKTDVDGDGILNTDDLDIDGDGIINIFDVDVDGDDFLNNIDGDDDSDVSVDARDTTPTGRGTMSDYDDDGIENSIDPDLDGDGIVNTNDSDLDGDGITNTKDEDDDNDGTPDVEDTNPVGQIIIEEKKETVQTQTSVGGVVIQNPNQSSASQTNNVVNISTGIVLGTSIDTTSTSSLIQSVETNNTSTNITTSIPSINSNSGTCPNYMNPKSFIAPGQNNNVNQVILLQKFLNKNLKLNISQNGKYGPETQNAVKAFQLKYKTSILKPWNIEEPTTSVYYTTINYINYLECKNNFKILKHRLVPASLKQN